MTQATSALSSPAIEGARKLTTPLVALLLVRAAFPLLARAGLHLGSAYRVITALLSFAAVVLFFVWSYQLISGLRARGVETRFSPGFAIGAWFIPFGNFV
jgi:hypothetical protein